MEYSNDDMTDSGMDELNEAVGEETEIPALVCFARADDVERENILAELSPWVAWLVHDYALPVRTVPPCWYRHEAYVHELSALRGAWLINYLDEQVASAPSDWHQVFHQTRSRLAEIGSELRCGVEEHYPMRKQEWSRPTSSQLTDEQIASAVAEFDQSW